VKEADTMTRTAIALIIALQALPAAAASKAASNKPSSKPAAPAASSGEINKLKGEFKWGMSSDDVVGKVQDKVRGNYQERLTKTANDPSRNDRLRKEMMGEVDKVKSSLVKFDEQKTGYDVSIVDREFLRNAGESMLVAKEENATRYFFFDNNQLYKMFIAFDKEILQGKSFREFGRQMQKRFGKAREVMVEDRTKAGVRVKLDHFIWSSKAGDTLRLVDRSEFYDVYCLVIYDSGVAQKQEQLRQARTGGPKSDGLIEAVTAPVGNDRDPNDNIIDRISGKETPKPGDQRGPDIKVPAVTPPETTPPPATSPPPTTAPMPTQVPTNTRPPGPPGTTTSDHRGGA
jgi:hypothetical protein